MEEYIDEQREVVRLAMNRGMEEYIDFMGGAQQVAMRLRHFAGWLAEPLMLASPTRWFQAQEEEQVRWWRSSRRLSSYSSSRS